MMAIKYQDLRNLSLDKLKQAYDQSADNTDVGLGFYRDEIARREADALNNRMAEFTHQIRNMTVAIVVLTIINTVIVAFSLYFNL